MNRDEYRNIYELEDRHWWYSGMRRIVASLLAEITPLRAGAAILDAGCGTGRGLIQLSAYGRPYGVDLIPDALDFCRERGLSGLGQASVDALPFRSESFDLVTSFDVLYHRGVGDDDRALAELSRVLRPGGWMLVRVPAHEWLRGAHDEVVHTRHRYTLAELGEKIERAGLRPRRLTYANALLMPAALARRALDRAGGGDHASDVAPTATWLNVILGSVLAAEAAWLRVGSLPTGVSALALAQRPS